MSSTIEQLVLEAGKSEELRANFACLREVCDGDGRPLFRHAICDKLATMITCRNHADTVFQLCHLLQLIQRVSDEGDYLDFMLRADANPALSIIKLVEGGGSGQDEIKLGQSDVELHFPDGRFDLHLGQMRLLQALFHFCLNTLEFEKVTEITDALAVDWRCDAAATASNALTKLIYDYLKDHLPTAQAHKKHRHIIHFLEEAYSPEFSAEQINDHAVLDFWCRERLSDNVFGTEFKLFKTVCLGFVYLRQALATGTEIRNVKYARSLGSDRESREVEIGEFDPGLEDAQDEHLFAGGRRGAIQELVGSITANPLGLLDEEPLRDVKFLTKTEREDLALIFEFGEDCEWLPLSLMRSELFHSMQIRVARADDLGRARIARAGPGSDYTEQRVRYRKRLDHLRRVSLAAVYVSRKGRWDDVEVGEAIVEDMKHWKQARDAFKGLNRAGFERDRLEDPVRRDAFQLALDPLRAISERVTNFIEQLDRIPGWEARFEDDRSVFAKRFENLYLSGSSRGE